jgi:L-ascorbate metabolism protein UlaG (beta-lactamase superfamily)
MPKAFLVVLVLLSGVFAVPPARAAEPGCRPEMASLQPRVIKAALSDADVAITFVGHASFLIETPRNVRAVTDYNDYVRAPLTPDVATMNKAHSTHYSSNPQPGITHLLPGWGPAGGKAEHDVTLLDMRIRNISTNIRSMGGSTEYDGNSIFVFEISDLCVVHLGHLHHPLEPGHIRAIGRADVVLAPVDGGWTLDMDGMMEVLAILQPKVIIPMHFFGQSTLNRFLSMAAVRWPVERREEAKVVYSRETLPRETRVVVLPGR